MKYLSCIKYVLVFAPLTLFAYDWPFQKTAELKAECVGYARASGYTEFARQIAAEKDYTSWIDETIVFCEEKLAALEGVPFTHPERAQALRLLDYPLHVDNRPGEASAEVAQAFTKAVRSYVQRSIQRVLREVKTTRIEPGKLRAWHIYNMAYVLKGPKRTVLIDFTTWPKFDDVETWTDADWQAFAELGDVLVVTHPHSDHYSYPLMRKMRAMGKPLVLPCAMTNKVDATEHYEAGEGVFVLNQDHFEPQEIGGVKFWNWIGFQWDTPIIPCNTYLMEIDGVRVADNGDNSDKDKERGVMKCPPADIIISATWNQVRNFVSACVAAPGFDRKHAIFLPSHDNELMHKVNHRESYREMYERKDRLGGSDFDWPRTIPLICGESYEFSRCVE